jgi:hypothetical protein
MEIHLTVDKSLWVFGLGITTERLYSRRHIAISVLCFHIIIDFDGK